MKRIILFRYHNNLEACLKQLQFIRMLNPDTPVYGLYGGEETNFEEWDNTLKNFLDGNYCIRGKDQFWKWINSDLAYRMWYRDYGHTLDFDNLVVLEWDLAFFESIDDLYKHIPGDALGLTGLTPLSRIEKTWFWSSDPVQRANWLQLLDYVKQHYQYTGVPYACVGGGASLPRRFLEKYADTEIPEIGNDELRMPLMGQVLGFRLADTGFLKKWFSRFESVYFNADNYEISPRTITKQLKKKKGRRAFHPVRFEENLSELYYFARK